MGIMELSYLFRSENFTSNDQLVVEYYTGSAWEGLETNAFDYVELPNFTYIGTIDIKAGEHTLSSDFSVRFRCEASTSTNAVYLDDIQLRSRLHSGMASLDIPPSALPDSYSTIEPKAIVEAAPGVLDNDSGTTGFLEAELVSSVSSGILNFYSDGSFAYGATNGFVGNDSFTYRAFDGILYSSTTTVTLTTNVDSGGGTLPTPIAHLTFDSNLSDASGNGYNGNYAGSGASISSTSKFGGGSLNTAGTGYVTIPTFSFSNTNSWSISLWYNAASATTAGLAGDNLQNNTLSYHAGGTDRAYYLRGNHSSGNGTWTTANTPTVLDTGVWHHLVVTSDGLGDTVEVYEDGNLLPNAYSGDPDNGMTFNRIGHDGNSSLGGNFNGLIDEVWIMGHVLDSDQVQDLYNNNGAGPSPATNLVTWAAVHGLTDGDALPYADGDNDSLFNILEYAFNLIPGVKDAYKLSAGGTSGLPRGVLKPGSGDRLQFEYVRRKNVSDIAYGVQFSDNLFSNWVDATMPETITSIDDDWERVAVEDAETVAGNTNRFGRVIIIQNGSSAE